MDTHLAKAHGTITYRTDGQRGVWEISAAPHVAVKIKRLLPRTRQNRSGTIWILDTPDTARDLEWITGRYPMVMGAATRAKLTAQADVHRDREQAIVRILAGQRLNTGVRTPARAPYAEQLESSDIVLATGRAIVTDEVGLGKSTTGLLTLRAADALPALIVTLTHLPKQWINKELKAVWPDLKGHIITSRTVYDPPEGTDVLAISYSKIDAWVDYLAGTVRTVIFDEIQELRHDGTNKYIAAGRIADAATYRVGLSATPVFNYGGEMHNIVNIVARDALGTREEFLREWGTDIGGDKIKVKDPKALGQHLRAEGLMIGHTRAEVGRELPRPIIHMQNVDADTSVLDAMAGDAVEMAKFILDRSNNSTKRWQQAGELDMRMRQATGLAKAPFVAEFVRMLLEGGTRRLVLWGWHRAVYDLWQERLADYHPVLYTGSESPTQKAKSVDRFMDGNARILIMSLRSGAGLDGLQMGCDTGVFGELDWSPQVPHQCIGRLARDGIAHAATAYFCVSDHGADPPMMEVLDIKRMQNDPMVNPRLDPVQPVQQDTNHMLALARSLVSGHAERPTLIPAGDDVQPALPFEVAS